jgi:hypothetical protein
MQESANNSFQAMLIHEEDICTIRLTTCPLLEVQPQVDDHLHSSTVSSTRAHFPPISWIRAFVCALQAQLPETCHGFIFRTTRFSVARPICLHERVTSPDLPQF